MAVQATSDPVARRQMHRPMRLSGEDLKGAWLAYEDLPRAEFYRANLERADLSNADLRMANLSRANLQDAELNGGRFQAQQVVMAANPPCHVDPVGRGSGA